MPARGSYRHASRQLRDRLVWDTPLCLWKYACKDTLNKLVLLRSQTCYDERSQIWSWFQHKECSSWRARIRVTWRDFTVLFTPYIHAWWRCMKLQECAHMYPARGSEKRLPSVSDETSVFLIPSSLLQPVSHEHLSDYLRPGQLGTLAPSAHHTGHSIYTHACTCVWWKSIRLKENASECTHMYPTERDEVVLILHIEEFFFGERLTRVRASSLLGEDHVSDV